jgi:hypothetical protein
MSLRKRKGQAYGDVQADIPLYLFEYSTELGYPTQQYADAVCACSNRTFALALDETEGAAVRTCTACKLTHPMADSDEYLDAAELDECACPCGAEAFELTVGVSLYEGTNDVRWLYVGARCAKCGLIGCYGDWKNEFIDFTALLSRV